MAHRLARLASVLAFAFGNFALAAEETRFTIKSYVIEGDNPLSTRATAGVLARFTGEQTGIGKLQQAAQALEAALHDAGWEFYRVQLPPQEVGDSVKLRVVHPSLAKIDVHGQRHSSEANVLRSLPSLQAGGSLNVRALARDIGLSNESQAREVAVTLKQGAQPDTLAADIEVRDRRPWSVLVSADNSGTDVPARSRMSVALQHANLFDRDHTLTLSYTTSPEAWSDVEQYGLFYTAPIYAWASSITAYAFHSSVNSGVIGDYFDVSGSGDFAGVGFSRRLWPVSGWRPMLRLAVDDRLFKDDTTFTGMAIGHDVRSRPVTVELGARKEAAWGQAGFYVDYLRNLSGGSHGDDVAYAAVRQGADPNWHLWRLGGSFRADMPKGLAIFGKASAQSACGPLIPGEQFGIGGQDSVRGLETRQVLGDSGIQASLELWSPPLFRSVTLVGFYDYGRVTREQPPAGTSASEEAQSVGVGIRWQIGKQANMALDYGNLVEGVTGRPAGDGRLYASMSARF